MNFLTKLERKFGKYAIKNLSLYIVVLYAAGYMIQLLAPNILPYITLEPYYIFKGQIWRIVSWLLIPPGTISIFTIITLFFYYSIGNVLERTWGAFRYNVYIFTGVFMTVVGCFLLYAVNGGRVIFDAYGMGVFSTYYISMSIFLAFAATYPNMQVLFMMFIPLKIKWLGIAYGVMIGVSMLQNTWEGRIVILCSLLNFIIFFLLTRNMKRYSPKEIQRKRVYKQAVNQGSIKNKVSRHKCAICGRTEEDGDHLEFRFCSKCNGNYEYCQDHLFTHTHVK